MRKNRKLYVSLLVIVCLLCLGIGYASLTGELTIGGSISTADANNLGKLDVYFVEQSLVSTSDGVTCTPSLTGTPVELDPESNASKYNLGYTSGDIAVTGLSTIGSSAVSKFVIVNQDTSTNNVKIGYKPKITYTGNEADAIDDFDINDYFSIIGYFDVAFTNEYVASKLYDSEYQTIELDTYYLCAFFVQVRMNKVPPVALNNIKIEIVLTYNATDPSL